jgi:hypothetical protein
VADGLNRAARDSLDTSIGGLKSFDGVYADESAAILGIRLPKLQNG